MAKNYGFYLYHLNFYNSFCKVNILAQISQQLKPALNPRIEILYVLQKNYPPVDPRTTNNSLMTPASYSYSDYGDQFYQQFTSSFYVRRSQKRKKTLMTRLSFCTFGICARKN